MQDKKSPLPAPRNQSLASLDRELSTPHIDELAETGQIVVGCQLNDRNAQRQLYERFGQKVYGLMVRMAGADDATDLTQQVFLHVFKTIGQFTAQARFDTWLYRVATNEALQHLRRRKRHPTASLPEEPLDGRPDRTRTVELRELLDRALQRLDPQLRSLFLLRELEELSYHEISDVLGIPEGTVGSRLNRARGDLRKHLVALGADTMQT
jgi:RNA polymerase sigma-70 factor (ECF subfamily)